MNEKRPSAFQRDAIVDTSEPDWPALKNEINPVWLRAQPAIRAGVDGSKDAAWFEALSPLSMRDGRFRIAVPNRFVRSSIVEHDQDPITEALEQSPGAPCQVDFIGRKPASAVSGDTVALTPRSAVSLRQAEATAQTPFNPGLTFDIFVVGPSNALAQATCLAVAQHPAQTSKPLFIYGDVGLGKTHLLHAIGNYLAQHDPHVTVCYVSSENFLNDLVGTLSDPTLEAFRNRYRQCDIILVDDVQFLMGKERTREAFFQTLNILQDDRKQIILTSDKPPQDMMGLETRLRSRFEWGLIADLQPPDVETKIKILKTKAAERQMAFPDDVAGLIARRLRGDVRTLEGALNVIEAYTEMTGQTLTVDLALSLISELSEAALPPISIDDIQRSVRDYYHLRGNALQSKTRTKELAHARHIAMYLVRMQTDASFPQIGRAFGNRDHTSVLHACNKVEDLVQDDWRVKEEVDQLLRGLQG